MAPVRRANITLVDQMSRYAMRVLVGHSGDMDFLIA